MKNYAVLSKHTLLGMALIVIIGNLSSCGRQITATLKADEIHNVEIQYRDSIVRKLSNIFQK